MYSVPKHWELCAGAIGWLRYKQRCPLVCWERTPFNVTIYRPDLVGVTRDRKVIEIELKQTLGDFKANRKKRVMDWRVQKWSIERPVKFYFAVPRALVEKAKPLLQEHEGLLTIAEERAQWGPEIEVITPASIDREATILSKLQIGRMVMHQTATLHRAIKALWNMSTHSTTTIRTVE